MQRYRKIYKQFHGAIPVDESGRTYDIHHRDGDRANNHPDNLQAVSIQEHFEIHLKRGDFGACALIAGKMKLSPEIISNMRSQENQKRVKDGTHHLLGGKHQRKLVEERRHPWLGPNANRRRVEAGTHNFLGSEFMRNKHKERRAQGISHPWKGTGEWQRERQLQRAREGTNPFCDKDKAKERTKQQIAAGTHNTVRTFTCPHCGKSGKGFVMKRWHFNKCASFPK